MRSIIAVSVVLIVAGLGYALWPAAPDPEQAEEPSSQQSKALAQVVLPDALSANAQIGKQAFDAKCAACHGANAEGQDGVAPPLVHIIYEPGHHGDESFQRAAAMGVRAHHWRFGDMPAVEGVTRGDVAMIIAYIRELQRANGIN